MNERLGRKLALTIGLIVASCLALIIPPVFLGRSPFRLGLDLQGGTRLVYRFDFEEARRTGQITEAEFLDRQGMLLDFSQVIRSRIDPNGVIDPSIRPEGLERIVVELPGAAELATEKTIGKLAQSISAEDATLALDAGDPELVKAFPPGGGVITLAAEKVSYGKRKGAELSELRRGHSGTTAAPHRAGDPVELLSTDDLQKRIENVGDLHFMVNASPSSLMPLGTDETKERAKLDTWLQAHPGETAVDFNRVAADQGGPSASLQWYPKRLEKKELDDTPAQLVLLHIPPEEFRFSGGDLVSVSQDRDPIGFPAVRFEIADEKKDAFGRFTEKHIGDQMAILLNGEIVTDPVINSRLPGSGIIEGGPGGFTQKEVKDLVTVLRSGSLRIRPLLLSKERIGATLGENYVRTGLLSTVFAFGLILSFMLCYYRKLGLFAVVGIFLNLLFLLGSMAFLKATLTLPGVAGIILTLGMAVDGNILIYERFREELGRGLKVLQAAKNAFERAAVTIIDSNLTTLIAGVILQNLGTGPIKGFAVTLNIGLLSTLFTVIVVTEILMFSDIRRGTTRYSMAPTFRSPKWRFMDIARYPITISAVLILGGVVLFLRLPDRDKLGMDFLGGFRVTVNTQEPHQVDEVAKLVHTIPGTVGETANVRQVIDSGSRSTGYRRFIIQCKLSGEEQSEQTGTEATAGEKEIRDVLEPLLQRDPIRLTVAEDGSTVSGEILFERFHHETDVQSVLAKAGFSDVTVRPTPDRPNVVQVSAKIPSGTDLSGVTAGLRTHLSATRDSAGKAYDLLSPVPESSVVGPTIGSELRDKAIIAVILSLVASVLFLRVRFAEYAYGFAVVAAVVHDVLVVIGGLAIATMTGGIQAELDLAMIAAFLTVIGYSQNDTIVIFDRVRENRRLSKAPLREILNESINQTLARTILTTTTVVLVLIILFAFNVGSRNVLEAFSFAMLVGVISGVYSTIYIASPVLLWFERFAAARAAKASSQAQAA